MKNSYKIMAFIVLSVGTGSVFAAEQNVFDSAPWLKGQIRDLGEQLELKDAELGSMGLDDGSRRRVQAERSRLNSMLLGYSQSLSDLKGSSSSDGRNSSSLGRRSGSSLGRRSVSFSPNPEIRIIPAREISVVVSAPTFAPSRPLSSRLPKTHEEETMSKPSFGSVRRASAIAVPAVASPERRSATLAEPSTMSGTGFKLERRSAAAVVGKSTVTSATTIVLEPLTRSISGHKPGAFHLPLLP